MPVQDSSVCERGVKRWRFRSSPCRAALFHRAKEEAPECGTNSWSKNTLEHSQDVKIRTCVTVLSQIQIWSLSLCFLPPVSRLISPPRCRSPLPSYLSVVSICSLSDRFGLWFRRREAGSISRVSVYSSWVMTLTVAVWSEHLLHLNDVVLDCHTVRISPGAWGPYTLTLLQAVEMSQSMQRAAPKRYSVQAIIVNGLCEEKENHQLCLFHFTQELSFMCTQTHISVCPFSAHTESNYAFWSCQTILLGVFFFFTITEIHLFCPLCAC